MTPIHCESCRKNIATIEIPMLKLCFCQSCLNAIDARIKELNAVAAKRDFVPCSENFERAFSSASGGCCRDCECGITFVDVHNTWDWEDGELEALLAKQAANPEKYIGQPHSVSTIYLEGNEYVMGCPKCDRPRKVEDWIINNARQLAEYLNLRAKDLAKEAKETTVKAIV